MLEQLNLTCLLGVDRISMACDEDQPSKGSVTNVFKRWSKL